MIKIGNPNHPKKGSTIKVEPIKKQKDIKAIKKLLANKPRDLALFTIGINTNLRASDLLRLKIGQVKDLKAGDTIKIKEQKIGKGRRITINKTCIKVIQNLLASKHYEDNDYLFQSQRRDVLTVPSVHKLVKTWYGDINLKGNYGSHTLRKTWGYHQRVTFGVDLPMLMVVTNLFFDNNVLNQNPTSIEWWVVPIRAIYFSVVTMTTLGFGDMYANCHSIFGHILLTIQVILGYGLLGALITRFGVLFTSSGPGQD